MKYGQTSILCIRDIKYLLCRLVSHDWYHWTSTIGKQRVALCAIPSINPHTSCCACVHACMRTVICACVRAYAYACVRASVRALMHMHGVVHKSMNACKEATEHMCQLVCKLALRLDGTPSFQCRPLQTLEVQDANGKHNHLCRALACMRSYVWTKM